MLIEPHDLSSNTVAEAVTRNWSISLHDISCAPVGFGSHHWWLQATDGVRWFATVDDLRMGDRSRSVLSAALETACQLNAHGLASVVAPVRTIRGHVVGELGPHYALALYPHIDGVSSRFGPNGSDGERTAVIHELVRLHQSTDLVRTIAPIDGRTIPRRSELEASLEALNQQWISGPFADRTRELLTHNRVALRQALTRYDRLAEIVASRQDRWVISHGEPHRANVIMTDHGVRLIDWETARLAPPERDLWMLIDENPAVAAEYTRRSGVALDDHSLQMYRSWWDLCEVSLYTADFRVAHDDNEETRLAWDGFEKHLTRASNVADGSDH